MPKTLLTLLPAVLLAGLSIGVIIGGLEFDAGTLTRMGPGFMPVLLGVLLLALALALGVGEWRARLRANAETHEVPAGAGRIHLRPILCASLSMVLWALTVERLGFIPAALLQLLLARAALPETDWKRAGLGTAVVSALAFVLFVMLLGLPLPAVGF